MNISGLSWVSHAPFSQLSRGMKTIAVIGAGLMGSGIAQISIQKGFQVHLVDLNTKLLTKSLSTIQKNITRVANKQYPNNEDSSKKFIDSCLSNLKISVDLKNAVRDTELVIEAIVEKLSHKHELFRSLEQSTLPNCLLVSNTSSLSLNEIGSVLQDQSRFAGLHFFQPVPVLRLVEVVQAAHTSETTMQTLMEFSRNLDKVPIVCRDTPGFVVNRLLVPYLLEAIHLVERGDATIRDVDIGMKLGAGYPMGPFELCDLIGLDTIKMICDSFVDQIPDDPSFLCPNRLLRLVEGNKLGRKSGEGFYKYDSDGKITHE